VAVIADGNPADDEEVDALLRQLREDPADVQLSQGAGDGRIARPET